MGGTLYSYIFKFLCYTGAGALSCYWCYKFGVEDEDLCLVDYKTLEKSTDDSVSLPMASLCFKNPFIEKRLKEIDSELNSTHYLNFLTGKVGDDRFKNVAFDNVTINLENHYLSSYIIWKNGSSSRHDRNSYNNLFDVVFNGMIDGKFFKCFGADVTKHQGKRMKYFSSMFNQTGILDDLKNSDHIVFFTYFHYPNQFLLANQNLEPFTDRLNGTGYELWFTIRSYEVLKRRNKRKMSCEKKWNQFDSLTMKEHIQSNGCKLPYLDGQTKEHEVCSNIETLKNEKYDVDVVNDKYLDQPCEEMSKINFGYTELFSWKKVKPFLKNNFVVIIGYPRNVKVIKQSKSIDLNSLIGIIGGYIGLFIGTLHVFSNNIY